MDNENKTDPHCHFEVEPVSEGLDEEINNYLRNSLVYKSMASEPDWKEHCVVFKKGSLGKFARHIVDWQKQQMMKDALDLKINRDTLYDLKPIIHEKYLDYRIGDRVKVIIIKDE